MNIDRETISHFGYEWTAFDQTSVAAAESKMLFDAYFRIFPWDQLPNEPEGMDVGCGSGRWAAFVAPRVAKLHCIDASAAAIEVARRTLSPFPSCEFHVASVDGIPIATDSLDFGYSLGVLHHLPDPLGGLKSCVAKLKPGAPFLLYVYYALENRPSWFRMLWRISDRVRGVVSQRPNRQKRIITSVIAAVVYLPLARAARLTEACGVSIGSFPLAEYRRRSFYSMRTDALDRFGTPMENRFTAEQVREMMHAAGLERVRLSASAPYWCAVGFKSS